MKPQASMFALILSGTPRDRKWQIYPCTVGENLGRSVYRITVKDMPIQRANTNKVGVPLHKDEAAISDEYLFDTEAKALEAQVRFEAQEDLLRPARQAAFARIEAKEQEPYVENPQWKRRFMVTTSALEEYMAMAKELLHLEETAPDSAEMDALLDRMDDVWLELTEAEIEESRHLCDALTGGEWAKAHPDSESPE